MNDTLDKGLVTFFDEVKYDGIFDDASVTIAQQAWTAGVPTASGSMTFTATQVIPARVEYFDTFIPSALRVGRYKDTMKKGIWNDVSDEFTKEILDGLVAGKISADAESKFWNAATSATQTAVAGLTPGTGQGSAGAAEQSYVASLTASQFDGVVTRMIYNAGGVGGRVKVAGTTITSSNIAAQYALAYAAVPALNLSDSSNQPVIYAPKSHRQLINLANLNLTNYIKAFDVTGGNYSYQDLKIEFVPLPENCIIIAKPSDIHWCTDSTDDITQMNIMPTLPFSKTWGYQVCFTEFAHVTHQSMNVLYLG